jgi:hypothetical protein
MTNKNKLPIYFKLRDSQEIYLRLGLDGELVIGFRENNVALSRSETKELIAILQDYIRD